MRYADNHKEETHKRLLKIAAGALREKGPDRLAVADVMKSAGLTHGGFYAHFKSKDAFLTETLGEVFAQSARRADREVEGLAPREALAAYIDYYVSVRHRDQPANGCPVVTLNSDLPRQSRTFRKAFDAGVRKLVASLERRMGEAGIKNSAELAPSIMATLVGAVALSRVVSDAALSENLLAATRREIKSRLGLSEN